MHVDEFFQNHKEVFHRLCQKHKVVKLFAFGSATRSDFDGQESDVDLLVQLDVSDPLERGDHLLSFWDEMEAFLNRKVDLLTEDSLHNKVLRAVITREKKLIYDREAA